MVTEKEYDEVLIKVFQKDWKRSYKYAMDDLKEAMKMIKAELENRPFKKNYPIHGCSSITDFINSALIHVCEGGIASVYMNQTKEKANDGFAAKEYYEDVVSSTKEERK